MYGWGDAEEPSGRLWSEIRDRLRDAGIDAPDALTWPEDLASHWTAPDLLLSHACGMPYRTRLHTCVTLVGASDCGLEGCPPGHYRSLFVAHKDDPRRDIAAFDGAVLAYNSRDSQSGWSAPLAEAARLGLTLRPEVETGAHRQSLVAVASGRADLAAIDAATWRMCARQVPVAALLRIVGATAPTPGLPFITAFPSLKPQLFAAIRDSLADLGPDDRATLAVKGIVALSAADYLAVPDAPVPAEAL